MPLHLDHRRRDVPLGARRSGDAGEPGAESGANAAALDKAMIALDRVRLRPHLARPMHHVHHAQRAVEPDYVS
jgi:hypothetical protein